MPPSEDDGNTGDLGPLRPIGIYRGGSDFPYAAPPQPGLVTGRPGRIELHPDQNFEAALEDLSGFSHVWVLFWCDRAEHWRPKVKPPRSDRRRGVFATRSPHRPNPIGLSCVELVRVAGRTLEIAGTDLLDGTPILDIKPYLPYADAHPEATVGWVPEEFVRFDLTWSPRADSQRRWLRSRGVLLDEWVRTPLTLFPFPRKGHRVRDIETVEGRTRATLACRTWRLDFVRDAERRTVVVDEIRSGHDDDALVDPSSRWDDVPVHREFLAEWAGTPDDHQSFA